MAFLLAISTGQRKSAILDLRVERVDWAANHLNFHNPDLRGKRKGRATVLIPDAIIPVLKDACDRSVSGYVVEKNGRKVTAPMLHHKWTLVRARAGLDNLWWHDLRRTWATMAAKNRVDMVQISKQLGHASVVITEQHYAHFHPDYMARHKNTRIGCCKISCNSRASLLRSKSVAGGNLLIYIEVCGRSGTTASHINQ